MLTELDRVELVDGVLYDVKGSTAAHSGTVAWLTRHFVIGVAAAGGDVRVQDCLFIAEGMLSPDLLVLDEIRRDQQPTTARLAVEVAVSSLGRDRRKATLRTSSPSFLADFRPRPDAWRRP